MILKKIDYMLFTGVFIFAMLFFCFCVDAGAQTSGSEELSKLAESNEVKLEKQIEQMNGENAQRSKANMAYDKLQNMLSDHTKLREKYAGAYINDNNELVINLTCLDGKVQNDILEATGSQKVSFAQKKFAYRQLSETYEKLKKILPRSKFANSINCYYIDEEKNAVVIESRDNEIKNFLKTTLTSNNCIKIITSKHKITPCKTYLKPGGYITNGNYEYSIGWRGWRINNAGNKTYGIVTAAHGNRLHQEAYSYSGTLYGKFVLRRYENNLDMAFVQRTNNNFGEVNTIKFSGSDLKAGYYVRTSYMKQGDKVYKAGMSSGLTSGKIISKSAQVNYDGKNFNDFVLTDVSSKTGDSGGIGYMDINGEYRIMGNVVSADITGNNKTFFVKAENIYSNVNIHPY